MHSSFSMRVLAHSLLLIVLLPALGAGPETDWPRYGHDPALTGRTPLRGGIAQPRLAWTYSMAGRELEIELIPAAGQHTLALSSSQGRIAVSPRRVPEPGPAMRDIDGTGKLRPAPETFHERWARLIPTVPGFQRVAWTHTWTTEKVCRLQCFAYDRGFDHPRIVWETDPPEDTIFSPLNIVHDIDGDGVREVLTAAHYRVMIFDGTTGRKETELRYHTSRPYGWFGLADVDGDRQQELITIGDFQSHVDVLDYDPRKPEPQRLSVRWRRDIETDIDRREKWPQVGPQPVIDVTGDGHPEIVINLFNDTGDGQWHVTVLNAANGQTVCDLPQRCLVGTGDTDRDGSVELFVTATTGSFVPTLATIELVAAVGGIPRVLWSREQAGWATWNLPALGATWSTTASQGMQQVLLAGDETRTDRAFFVRGLQPDHAGITLTALCRHQPEGVKELWRAEGLSRQMDTLAMADLPEHGGTALLANLRLPGTAEITVRSSNVRAQLVKDEPLGIRVSSPIAARLHPGGPTCAVVEGPGEVILAIAPPMTAAESPRLLWQRPGRGMADGARAVGPLAVDLDGDGTREVIIADQTPAGQALLLACRHDGSILWSHPFEQTPGAPPVWNQGALTFWWPGRYRETGRTDLLVQTRRGLMHSDIGHLLDGRDGSTFWTQSKAVWPDEFSWAYAGIPVAVVDVTGDRLDEIVNLHPVCFWIADGASGRLTAGRELASKKVLPAWAAYGEPIVHDFTGDGKPDVLLNSLYILALLDLEGKPIWHGPPRADYPTDPGRGNVGETTATRHALIDLDADGTFEIASAGYGDGVRAVDPRDGKVLWSLHAPEPTCQKVAAADIDGHDGDELLYTAGDKLVAITGDRSAGRVLWTWQGPANLSMPAIADTDGDGMAEIILQSADGGLHCIDAAGSTSPG